MGGVVADTHAVLWYLLEPDQLTSRASEALDGALATGDGIWISSISLIEVTYLVEKGKLPRSVIERLDRAAADEAEGLKVAAVDLGTAQELRHVPRDIVPDMPDRIIAATAAHLGMPLVTRDPRIQRTGVRTVW